MGHALKKAEEERGEHLTEIQNLKAEVNLLHNCIASILFDQKIST